MPALTCPPSLLLCKIHDSKVQPNLPKQVCARLVVCFIKKDFSIWEKIGMRDKMVGNLFPNQQFRKDMFHSQRGTRKKGSLIINMGTICPIHRWEFGTKGC